MVEIPVIALVGRPNVGKSTLFNRLAGSRKALVAATPGVTRDRREEEVWYENFHFKLIDTGGMAFQSELEFSKEISEQVEAGVMEADCIWLIMDANEGMSPIDQELYRWLIRGGKPLLVVVNKADNISRRADISDFYSLGTDLIFSLSAIHGSGVTDALEKTVDLLPSFDFTGGEVTDEELDVATGPVRIAFVGRPNVGKSSLVNRIIDESRMIVSDIAGTTREAVEIPFQMFDKPYILIDTAGIRRKARTKEYLDKISALNAIKAMKQTDVAVLVVDATEDASDQDAKIAGYILEKKRAVVIAFNKWDISQKSGNKAQEIEEDLRYKLRFMDFAPIIRCSAVTGMGMKRLFKEIEAAFGQFNRRIQTADLNRVVQMALLRQSPPARGRVPTKVLYGSQIRNSPPTFCLITNHIKEISESYKRFMENQFRYHFGFKGTPLTIIFKARKAGKGKNERK